MSDDKKLDVDEIAFYAYWGVYDQLADYVEEKGTNRQPASLPEMKKALRNMSEEEIRQRLPFDAKH